MPPAPPSRPAVAVAAPRLFLPAGVRVPAAAAAAAAAAAVWEGGFAVGRSGAWLGLGLGLG